MPDAPPFGPPRLKSLLAGGKQLLGTWITARDPFFVESLAYVGYDLLLIEAEHTPLTMGDIEMMLIAIQGSQSIPVVRMPWNDQVKVKQVLDMGVEAMVVPFVRSAEDARRLVSYSMYPPEGVRGINPRRAQHLVGSPWDYAKVANDYVCPIPQIELIDAVNEIDAICAVPRLGGVFLGPSDLSLSMNLPGQMDHPDFVAARDRIWEASRRHRLPFAVASYSLDDARMWIQRGAEMVFFGQDLRFMVAQAKETLGALKKARGG